MEEYVFELGELDVFIMGKHLPLRRLPFSLQEKIVLDLSEILVGNLESRYGGKFSFEILKIEDGCIKARLLLTWSLVVGMAGGIIAYPGLKAGAQELWNDGNAVIEFVVEGRACEARFSGVDFINGIYGPVKKGESLSAIAASFDCGDFTEEQVMVAIYKANPEAFPTQNMNLILENELIVIPRERVIEKTNATEASRIVEEHARKFYNK